MLSLLKTHWWPSFGYQGVARLRVGTISLLCTILKSSFLFSMSLKISYLYQCIWQIFTEYMMNTEVNFYSGEKKKDEWINSLYCQTSQKGLEADVKTPSHVTKWRTHWERCMRARKLLSWDCPRADFSSLPLLYLEPSSLCSCDSNVTLTPGSNYNFYFHKTYQLPHTIRKTSLTLRGSLTGLLD